MKIKLSKSQWELVGRKTGWMKKADIEVTIWEFLDDWGEEGYGIALVNPDDEVVSPYITDGSDYPDMVLNKSGNYAKVISGKYKDYYIVFHSGQLEAKVGKEYFDENISKFPRY